MADQSTDAVTYREAKERFAERWRVPIWLQEFVAALMVPLLLAGLYGIFSLRDTVNSLASDLEHVIERNDIVHANLNSELDTLKQWKETFGAKPRWGADDAEKQENLLRRDIDRQESRLDLLSESYFDHDKKAQGYIRDIGNNGRNIDSLSRRLDRVEAKVTGHLTFSEHKRNGNDTP